MSTQVNVIQNDNQLTVNSVYNTITVIDNNREGHIVEVIQPISNVVTINTGFAGVAGPVGPAGPTGSSIPFSNKGGDVWFTTSSIEITGSFTVSGSNTFKNIGPAIFSGSINISGSTIFTGSVQGNLTGSLLGTASYASQALTASYALNVIDTTFPYTGSAIISGSLAVTGSTGISSTLNVGGQATFNSFVQVGSTLFANLNPTWTIQNTANPGSLLLQSRGSAFNNFMFHTNGYFGINQLSPSMSLDVSGSGRFTGNLYVSGSTYITGSLVITGSTNLISIHNTSGSSLRICDWAGSTTTYGYGIVSNHDSFKLPTTVYFGDSSYYVNKFLVNGSLHGGAFNTFRDFKAGSGNNSRIFIYGEDSTGNVGIGTTSPSHSLDVSGSGRFRENLYTTGSINLLSDTAFINIRSLVGATSFGAIYIDKATPSVSNYSLIADTNETMLNGVTNVYLRTSNGTRLQANSTNVLITVPTIITGSLTASGSLNVSGSQLNWGDLTVNAGNIKVTTSGSVDEYISFNRAGSNGWASGRSNTGARYIIAYNSTGDATLTSSEYLGISNTGDVTIGKGAPISGSLIVSGSTIITGSLNTTGSLNVTGSSKLAGKVLISNDVVTPSNLLTIGDSDSSTTQLSSAFLNIFNSSATTNNYANIAFGQSGAGSNSFSRFGVQYIDRTGGSEDQDFFWGTVGGGVYSEKMRLTSTGNLSINRGNLTVTGSTIFSGSGYSLTNIGSSSFSGSFEMLVPTSSTNFTPYFVINGQGGSLVPLVKVLSGASGQGAELRVGGDQGAHWFRVLGSAASPVTLDSGLGGADRDTFIQFTRNSSTRWQIGKASTNNFILKNEASGSTIMSVDYTTGLTTFLSGSTITGSLNITGSSILTGSLFILAESGSLVNIGNTGSANQRILRVGQSQSFLDFGSIPNSPTLPGIWLNQTAPSSTNYALSVTAAGGTVTALNASSAIRLRLSNIDVVLVDSTAFTFTPFDTANNATTNYKFNAGTNTNQTTGTPIPKFVFNIGSTQWNSGSITSSQGFINITQPTMSFTNQSTASMAATFRLIGGVSASTSASITENAALLIDSGSMGSNTERGYGALIYAPVSASISNAALGLRGNLIQTGSTYITGSLTITGSASYNNNTIATLPDVRFSVQMGSISFNPADATTYYDGMFIPNNSNHSQGTGKIYIPQNCTLIGYSLTLYNNGGVGTNETSSISCSINNSTLVTLDNVMDVTKFPYTSSASNLNTNINAGDYVELRWTTPTWGTNPVSTAIAATLWFKGR